MILQTTTGQFQWQVFRVKYWNPSCVGLVASVCYRQEHTVMSTTWF